MRVQSSEIQDAGFRYQVAGCGLRPRARNAHFKGWNLKPVTCDLPPSSHYWRAMMEPMIAYCGLNCSECGALKATLANDAAEIERVAATWRVEHHNPGITAEGVWCEGCLTEGRRCFHCAQCDIRACGVEHRVANCAHCDEYETCAKMARFGGFVPQAKATLDAIRASL